MFSASRKHRLRTRGLRSLVFPYSTQFHSIRSIVSQVTFIVNPPLGCGRVEFDPKRYPEILKEDCKVGKCLC